jgi:hypothetical protein
MRWRVFLCVLLLVAQAVHAWASPLDLYVNNKRLDAAVVKIGKTLYASPEAVAERLHARYEDGAPPRLNEKPLASARSVKGKTLAALAEIAAALGARLMVNEAVGVIDLITFDPVANAKTLRDAPSPSRETPAVPKPPLTLGDEAVAVGSSQPGAAARSSEEDHVVARSEMDSIRRLADDGLAGQLGMRMTVVPVCHWLTLPELRRVAGSDYVLGFTIPRKIEGRVEVDIFVPYGLPYSEVVHIMTHERAHCWEAEVDMNLSTKVLSEGFAEWASYVVLRSFHMDGEAARVEARLPDDYGRGFHYFQRLAEKYGLSDTVQRILRLNPKH